MGCCLTTGEHQQKRNLSSESRPSCVSVSVCLSTSVSVCMCVHMRECVGACEPRAQPRASLTKTIHSLRLGL